MKLTVSCSSRQRGFALPTILLVSVIMTAILAASIAAAAGSRVALNSQYYNELAREAAESGIIRANECLKNSGYTPQWSTAASGAALTPATGCTGTGTSYSAYLVSNSNLQTFFSIDAPSGSGIGSSLKVTGTTQLLRTSTNAGGGHDVWRSYTYVTYLQIEPPQTIPCPDGFIPVPGNPTFSTSDFCVMKYEAKNVNGAPASTASGTPYTNVTQAAASAAAANACSGCHLITEAEWLTIANNVVNVASNWSGGSVGSGYIYSGHNNSNPNSNLDASTDDTNGYYGTGLSSGNQRRTLTLSNGKVIWDFAGNAWEWTTGQITGNQPGASGYAWREWNTVTDNGAITPDPFPSIGTAAASGWNSTNGIGELYSSSTDGALKGFIRGGSRSDGAGTGIFTLNMTNSPTGSFGSVGFRVTR